MRRLTAALLALTGVLALAGCATDGAGAGVRSPRFTRAVLAALDADGFATDGNRQVYRTTTVYPSTSASAAKRWVRGRGC